MPSPPPSPSPPPLLLPHRDTPLKVAFMPLFSGIYWKKLGPWNIRKKKDKEKGIIAAEGRGGTIGTFRVRH
jgi:hypothetical protein